MLDLPVGARLAFPRVINDNGQIAGVAIMVSDYVAARWEADGTPTLLEKPDWLEETQTLAMNERGEVVGYGLRANEYIGRPLRWATDGSMTVLNTDTPYGTMRYARATGINDSGRVVGYGYIEGVGGRALTWAADGTLTVLGDDTSNREYSAAQAFAIDSGGRVVGNSYTGVPSRNWQAVIWELGS